MDIKLEGVKFRRTDEGQVIYAYSGKVMPDMCDGNAYDVEIKQRVQDEVIEVGDDITVKQHPCLNNDTVCEVVDEDDEKFHLRTRDIIYSWKDVNSRTLIRKGPKVHTFEGPTITITGGGRFISFDVPGDLPDGEYNTTLREREG